LICIIFSLVKTPRQLPDNSKTQICPDDDAQSAKMEVLLINRLEPDKASDKVKFLTDSDRAFDKEKLESLDKILDKMQNDEIYDRMVTSEISDRQIDRIVILLQNDFVLD